MQNNSNDNNDNWNNSISGVFRVLSYKNEKENNSGDTFEELKSEYEILVESSKNELPFQILQNLNLILMLLIKIIKL